MNETKKILLIVILIIIALIITALLLYKNGKKKIEILLEMSKNMYELNDGKDDNVYMRSKGNYGYTEVYKYLEVTKFVVYNKNKQVKITSILSNTEDISYLEGDDGTIKVMCIRNQEKTDESIIEDEMFANDEANIFEIIFYGLNIRLSNENVDNKECYKLKLLDSNETYYIDKETFLPVKEVGKSIDENGKEITDTISYDIQYNIVKKDDVQKLDEKEFKLIDEVEFDKYYESNNI